MSPSTKDIVVLGGSYGGKSTAHYALKHVLPPLPQSDSYRVVLISASSEVTCRPACPRALLADDMLDQAKLFVDIKTGFEQYGDRFSFINGSVTRLDHKARTVSYTAGGEPQSIDYYALVIATGATTPSPLFSLAPDTEGLRSAWITFRKAFAKARSIIIAGGGPTGVETAGELGEFLNGRDGWLSSRKPKVEIVLITSAPAILPYLRPSIAAKAEDFLAKVGVTVLKNVRVESVSPETAGTRDIAAPVTVTLGDGRVLEADLYVPAVGTTPNTSFADRELLQDDGRIRTTPALRVDEAGPRVYAIGDVASSGRPAVHNVLNAVPVLGANMKRDLMMDAGVDETEAGTERVFEEDKRETQLVPIGRSKGVGAAFGYQVPSFMVWLIKGRDYWLGTTGALWSGKHWAKET